MLLEDFAEFHSTPGPIPKFSALQLSLRLGRSWVNLCHVVQMSYKFLFVFVSLEISRP
jgi:hypothetical protein